MKIATRDVPALFERTELQKKIDAVVLERVKKGFLLLQEKHGADWIDKIDLRKLKLSDGSACVLGQVYAYQYDDDGYSFGKDDLDLDSEQAEEHGFQSDNQVTYEALDEAWQAVIREAYAVFA